MANTALDRIAAMVHAETERVERVVEEGVHRGRDRTVILKDRLTSWINRTTLPLNGRRSPDSWDANGAVEIDGATARQVAGRLPGRHLITITNLSTSQALKLGNSSDQAQSEGITLAASASKTLYTEGPVTIYNPGASGVTVDVDQAYWSMPVDLLPATPGELAGQNIGEVQ